MPLSGTTFTSLLVFRTGGWEPGGGILRGAPTERLCPGGSWMDCGRISGCCPEPYRGSGIVSCWVTAQSRGRRDTGEKAETCIWEWTRHSRVASGLGVFIKQRVLEMPQGTVRHEQCHRQSSICDMLHRAGCCSKCRLGGKDSGELPQMTATPEPGLASLCVAKMGTTDV